MPKALRALLDDAQDVEHLMKGRACGFISACRSENSPKENERNTNQLRQTLESRGHKVVPVKGGFIENKGTPQEKHVDGEDSFFVGHKHQGNDGGRVYRDLIDLGKRYKQESIIHKPHDSDVASFHGTKKGADPDLGQHQVIGKAHWDKEAEGAEYYTKTQNGRQFTFK
jgi:hypothetical protein